MINISFMPLRPGIGAQTPRRSSTRRALFRRKSAAPLSRPAKSDKLLRGRLSDFVRRRRPRP